MQFLEILAQRKFSFTRTNHIGPLRNAYLIVPILLYPCLSVIFHLLLTYYLIGTEIIIIYSLSNQQFNVTFLKIFVTIFKTLFGL